MLLRGCSSCVAFAPCSPTRRFCFDPTVATQHSVLLFVW